MKTRRLKVESNGNKTIVFFGSYGVNGDGTAKFFNPQNKHDNYSTGLQGVVDGLTQRLSVIKNELWYNINYGLPLIDKHRTKGTIDAYVARVILNHPDIKEISSFISGLENNNYYVNFIALSRFGEIRVQI